MSYPDQLPSVVGVEREMCAIPTQRGRGDVGGPVEECAVLPQEEANLADDRLRLAEAQVAALQAARKRVDAFFAQQGAEG